MSPDCDDDPILRHVSQLPQLPPDRRRADRVRARCRARLAPSVSKRQRDMAPALFAGLCLLYLSAIVYDVVLLRELL